MAMIKTKIDMNSHSKQIRIILLMMFLISSISYAQVKVTIKGKVQDEKGAPILGATVFLNNNQGNVKGGNGGE